MSDTSSHDAPPRDELHTITLRELEARVGAAGALISRRQLMRHCQAGTFDAQKLPAVNNIMEWFVAPASIDKGIADIKTLQEQRARRVATRPDMTSGVAMGRSMVPISLPSPEMFETPRSCVSDARSAKGRFQFSALRNDATRLSGVIGNSTWTRAPGGRGVFDAVASVISAIGVMPAMGCLGKLPSE